jgi:hypothetical protein
MLVVTGQEHVQGPATLTDSEPDGWSGRVDEERHDG